MNCPVCNVSLLMTERQGVEIDYCPQCRGIWLDRGELEKIIERSGYNQANPQNNYPPNGMYYDDHHDHQDKHYNKHGRRRGMLGDLFDF